MSVAFQDRVTREKEENTDFLEATSNRRDQLRKFLASSFFGTLPTDERKRLRLQLNIQNVVTSALDQLGIVLDERIENFQDGEAQSDLKELQELHEIAKKVHLKSI